MHESKHDVEKRILSEADMNKVHVIKPLIEKDLPKAMQQRRVAVYCRVSTDSISQAVSFNLQKKYYIKYVKDNINWKLIGLYSDEGRSATTTKNRPGLQMMLRDAAEGKFDLIITKSISRLSRNLGDSIQIIKDMKKITPPVCIFFETEGIDTFDPNMDLIIKVLAMVAEQESKKKSESIIASYRQRYGSGIFTIPDSLGYKKIGVNQIGIDIEEAETVRLIYDMFLSGFNLEEIADTLVKLRRKKHTHIYTNGEVKEGDLHWTKASIINVLENEKKCGDVLAQKTYTVDPLEHTVKKNVRKVAQYYAVDQHEPIISREQFYLALRIYEANKGGWDKGIQILHTYIEGPLKGYILTIPQWLGFHHYDYLKASLSTYGVTIPEKSMYPEYVFDGDSSEQQDYAHEEVVKPYYEITDEDLDEDLVVTDEEYEVLEKIEPLYQAELDRVREELIDIRTNILPVGAQFFGGTDKPVATLDKNGIQFNLECANRLGKESVVRGIELLYNPIINKILVRIAEGENPATKLLWIKNGKTHRCSTPGIATSIYHGMNWNSNYKYRVYGTRKKIDGNLFLEFDLNDPVISVRTTNKSTKIKDLQNKVDVVVENALYQGNYEENHYSELEECVEYLQGKVDRRSKAVLFKAEEDENKNISIEKMGDEKFSPEFIEYMVKEGKAPVEGWDYLRGYVRWKKDGFEVLRQSPANRGFVKYKNEEGQFITRTADLGWTTEYVYPNKADVTKRIKKMQEKYN